MLKVAIVAPTISHFEVPLFRIAANMQGLDVHVFHNDLRDDAFADADYGTTIHWGEQLKAGYANTGFATVTDLKAAVMDWSPDVAMLYGYAWKGAVGLLAQLRRAGIPIVHRGLLTPYFNTRQNPILTRVWRLFQPALLKCFHAHHYGGSYSETVLKRAGIEKAHSYFVPFSVDTPYFASQADSSDEIAAARDLRRRLGWAEHNPVLLFLCQHSWFKAPDVMMRVAVEAQSRHPALKLIMAGSGKMTEDLKIYAEQHLTAGSYHFPGYVSSKSTMPYYLAADLVLFPSRYDTWSRGVNEAMLARRPCIVSRIVPAAGGLVEEGENGYVVDPLEPGPFVARIDEFLSLSPERRAAMGEAARTRAQYFSYEAHADELRRSFVETAERAGRSQVRSHA
jgi:glycosyltransferase involved in cell wall biosynthesis